MSNAQTTPLPPHAAIAVETAARKEHNSKPGSTWPARVLAAHIRSGRKIISH
jgi:hypothetical protein